ncbi:MAG: hypothetical protein H0U92_11000 [Actinobacteria bacterium]|nr:hypothetical protein [Actinomycetota bacterium]
MRDWITWFARGLWKRRRSIQILIGITAAFILLVLWQNRDVRPARTMTDPQFERASITICEKSIPSLRAVRREDETEADLEKETAREVDRVATKLEAVVAQLRGLEVRPQNEKQVADWFSHFDDYILAGRHYADALRTGKDKLYNQVDDEGVEPLMAISKFARANRIDACIP